MLKKIARSIVWRDIRQPSEGCRVKFESGVEVEGSMYLFDKAEITADGTEDALLHALAAAMRARGFALLGVIARCEADGALATLGESSITESAEFKDILRVLADEIEMAEGRRADLTVPSA